MTLSPFKGFLDTLKNMRHRLPGPVFCPKCRSSKIRLKESFGILPPTYQCQECNYEGVLVLELEPDEE